ncbi:CD82 molecule b [Pristis pectinata]|uniref:CD82 molecule b n=1 Tax=Pristis pectinata TaxID=685728 RepID=UPI00223D1186|nr:CD82 molecule b [Pristis pectinata]XP_051885423.1 CD82 molecule b [Pristis pectinata]XP_051885424.1 CD82 molecule b [Pristis pectinata]
MGKGCIKATKYFLFLFNLLFFILGAVILGFGLWILLDNTSFIAVLQSSSSALRIGSYILLGVGSVTMLMGFLGCLGAVNEVKCLLGLYFTCLLLILIAQITAGVLIYLQRDALKAEIADVIHQMIVNYNPQDNQGKSFGATWDYIQRKLHCCGWMGPANWTENLVIRNSSGTLYPCSCHQRKDNDTMPETGFCKEVTPYDKGCVSSVEEWLYSNIGLIFGVCIGVAVIELLGMVLSMCLCKNVEQEDYSKVPRY